MIAEAAILWLATTTGGAAPLAPLPALSAQVDPASSPHTGPSRLYTPNHPAGVVGDGPRDAGSRATGVRPSGGTLGGDTRDPSIGTAPTSDAGGQTPRQIVESSRLSPPAALALIVVSLLITGGVLWSAFWWWRVKTESPGDRAVRVLSRRWRLSPGHRDSIIRAARARGVPAVALLVSPSALSATLGAGGHAPSRA